MLHRKGTTIRVGLGRLSMQLVPPAGTARFVRISRLTSAIALKSAEASTWTRSGPKLWRPTYIGVLGGPETGCGTPCVRITNDLEMFFHGDGPGRRITRGRAGGHLRLVLGGRRATGPGRPGPPGTSIGCQGIRVSAAQERRTRC